MTLPTQTKKAFVSDPIREKELEEKALAELLKTSRVLKDAGYKLRVEGGDLDIARIGHWVWIEGEIIKTDAKLRGLIKGLGYKFNGKRVAWSWSPYTWKGKRSPLSLDQLAVKHGYSLGGV